MNVTNQVTIRDFESGDEQAFRQLNLDWITKYFTIEQIDLDQLDHPRTAILEDGGAIVIAELNGEVVGCCALVKEDDVHYELAKMAVSEIARGHGIAYQMGLEILNKARRLGAETVHLESNTVLTPAINLYKKLGFEEYQNETSPYARCNVQMSVRVAD